MKNKLSAKFTTYKNSRELAKAYRRGQKIVTNDQGEIYIVINR
jgi:hypothetical protein